MFFIDKPEIVITIIKPISCIRLTIFKTFNTVSFFIFLIFTFSYHQKILPILIIINIRNSSIVTEEMNTNVACVLAWVQRTVTNLTAQDAEEFQLNLRLPSN